MTTLITTVMACLFAALLHGCSDNPVAPSGTGDDLEYVTPEQVGWSSEKLQAVEREVGRSGYAAMMALYDGKVFFSWGDISRNFHCHSIRKPFLSALYGIYVARGEIDLEATLDDLNIDDIAPSLTQQEKQAKVKDLLKSRSGVYHEAAAEAAIMVDQRPARGSHKPGTFFYYNNWDFNALGTIFEQETGAKIFDAFRREIADPIGMQDFDLRNCRYQYEPKSMHPAYHFRMSARDMARFGVLFQKNGIWNGERIVPANWIAESTQTFSIMDNQSGIGYGYMWKVFPKGSFVEKLMGHPGFFHTGNSVHALVIIPELKLVIVQRYDTDEPGWQDPGDVSMKLGLMLINSRK